MIQNEGVLFYKDTISLQKLSFPLLNSLAFVSKKGDKMIYNILFLIISICILFIRYKNICKDCGSSKKEDFFQLLFILIGSFFLIGSKHIIILVALILISFVLKKILFYVPQGISNVYCKRCNKNDN